MKPPMNMLDNSTTGKEPELPKQLANFYAGRRNPDDGGAKYLGQSGRGCAAAGTSGCRRCEAGGVAGIFCPMGMSDADKVAVCEQADWGPIQEFLAIPLSAWVCGLWVERYHWFLPGRTR